MRLRTIAFALAFSAARIGAQQTLPPGTEVPETAPAPAAASQPDTVLSDAEDKIEHKDFATAQLILQKYLSAHAGDARALFDSGYLAELQDQAAPAAAYYRRAIAADPKQFEARLALGLLLARQGEADQAREQISAATRLEPAVPNPAARARAFRALAQLDRHTDPTAAGEALLEALKISPESSDDTLLTAEIAEAANDTATAEAAYRRVLSAEPGSSAAAAGLAHLLIQGRRYPDAEDLLRHALGRDPNDPALGSQLASTLMAENKPDEALALLTKLHQLQPADLAIERMLTESLEQSSDPAAAETTYLQLLSKSPRDGELLAAYGQNLLRQKKYPEAVAIFQKATAAKPDNGDAWSGLAFAASETHQYSITLDALTMRSKYLPDSPASYFLRATAYDSLHVSKAAAESYRKFLAAAQGKFPDQEWQAKHRLTALEKLH